MWPGQNGLSAMVAKVWRLPKVRFGIALREGDSFSARLVEPAVNRQPGFRRELVEQST